MTAVFLIMYLYIPRQLKSTAYFPCCTMAFNNKEQPYAEATEGGLDCSCFVSTMWASQFTPIPFSSRNSPTCMAELNFHYHMMCYLPTPWLSTTTVFLAFETIYVEIDVWRFSATAMHRFTCICTRVIEPSSQSVSRQRTGCGCWQKEETNSRICEIKQEQLTSKSKEAMY